MEETRDEALDLLVELARPSAEDVALDYAVMPTLASFVIARIVSRLEAVAARPDTVEEGRRLAAELGLTNVEFRLASLPSLPHPAGTFSLVMCSEGLHLATDPVASLREMDRVTSPGGRVVIVEPVVDDVLDGPLNDLARLREPSHHRYYRPEGLEQLAAEAGLRATARGVVRRTVDLDYWLQAAGAPAAQAVLVSERFKELPVAAQVGLDAAFSDGAVSFSYDVLGLRLERAQVANARPLV